MSARLWGPWASWVHASRYMETNEAPLYRGEGVGGLCWEAAPNSNQTCKWFSTSHYQTFTIASQPASNPTSFVPFPSFPLAHPYSASSILEETHRTINTWHLWRTGEFCETDLNLHPARDLGRLPSEVTGRGSTPCVNNVDLSTIRYADKKPWVYNLMQVVCLIARLCSFPYVAARLMYAKMMIAELLCDEYLSRGVGTWCFPRCRDLEFPTPHSGPPFRSAPWMPCRPFDEQKTAQWYRCSTWLGGVEINSIAT
jgi:hypothetical protein